MPATGIRFSTLISAVAFFVPCAAALSADLPKSFVRLADMDSTIRQDIRYAGSRNFLGRPAKDYRAPVCILTREAAAALVKVQKSLAGDGLTLVVFDCYRPAGAVADFVEWTKQPAPADPRWHPKVRRGDLIAKGYIGERSTHSRGSTVDVALAPLTGAEPQHPACGADTAETLDFGTGFDCFDEASASAFSGFGATASANRKRLVEAMRAEGFRNYRGEWWHFTLKDEPFKQQRFDFPVTAGN